MFFFELCLKYHYRRVPSFLRRFHAGDKNDDGDNDGGHDGGAGWDDHVVEVGRGSPAIVRPDLSALDERH